jgi:hypothetical protein
MDRVGRSDPKHGTDLTRAWDRSAPLDPWRRPLAAGGPLPPPRSPVSPLALALTRGQEVTSMIFVFFVAFVAFSIFVFFVAQKSICALTFAKRAVITDVGVSHRPLGMNAWL